jgi:hypothetical protein
MEPLSKEVNSDVEQQQAYFRATDREARDVQWTGPSPGSPAGHVR